MILFLVTPFDPCFKRINEIGNDFDISSNNNLVECHTMSMTA